MCIRDRAAINSVISCLSGVFSSILSATERVELMNDVKLYDYLRSKLFYLPSVRIIFRVFYLFGIYLMLRFVGFSSESPSLIVLFWFLLRLGLNLGFLFRFYLDARPIMRISFPWRNVSRYFFSSLIMFTVLWFLGLGQKVYSIFSDAFYASVVGVSVGVSVYFVLTYILDEEFRNIIKSVFRWLSLFRFRDL